MWSVSSPGSRQDQFLGVKQDGGKGFLSTTLPRLISFPRSSSTWVFGASRFLSVGICAKPELKQPAVLDVAFLRSSCATEGTVGLAFEPYGLQRRHVFH